MKLAVVDNLPEGGAKRVVFEQIKYLSKKHQVVYYTNQVESIFSVEKYGVKKKVFPLQFLIKKNWHRPLSEIKGYLGLRKTYQKIAKEIHRHKPDVILVHPDQYTQAPWILQFLRLPSLYFIEETLRIFYEVDLFPLPSTTVCKRKYEAGRRFFLSRIDKKNLQAASALMVSSHFVKKEVQQFYHRLAKINHLGVDTSIFYPSRSKASLDHFLFIGEKEKINGYPWLKKALIILKKKVQVKIKYVTFSGQKFTWSDKEIASLSQKSIAILCLSEREPFGLVALESMACGVPVIARNEGGYKETVVDQKTGYLIEDQPQQLAQVMKNLLVKSKLRSKLGENGVKRVKANFTWKQHGQRLEKELFLLCNN